MKKHRIYSVSFASIYPLYLQKVERKGRTKEELDTIICWLTGYSRQQLPSVMDDDMEFFFSHAPALNPKRMLITGLICGVQIESIKDPLMKEILFLDKLVDELAKGKPMDYILRQ